ncbi:MAG: chorismate mutase [Candidatus Tokpelaia sp. JSC188]|nr:MAG: chorismate mutase [Candidatus Tokpelaia sp. JSC188]
MKQNNLPKELLTLRASINNFDAALVHILAERFRCTKAVGVLKARYKLPFEDCEREKQQIERLRAIAKESQLDSNFVEKFFNFILCEVIQHHKDIAAEYPD